MSDGVCFLLCSLIYGFTTAIVITLAWPLRPWRRLISLAFRWKRQAVRLSRENIMLEIEASRWRGACYRLGGYVGQVDRSVGELQSKLKEIEDANTELRKKVLPDAI